MFCRAGIMLYLSCGFCWLGITFTYHSINTSIQPAACICPSTLVTISRPHLSSRWNHHPIVEATSGHRWGWTHFLCCLCRTFLFCRQVTWKMSPCVKTDLSTIGFKQKDIFTSSTSTVPPWPLKRPFVDLSLDSKQLREFVLTSNSTYYLLWQSHQVTLPSEQLSICGWLYILSEAW